ncbi:MAG: ABC transporter permease [Chthoniobacteraceae bacterium]
MSITQTANPPLPQASPALKLNAPGRKLLARWKTFAGPLLLLLAWKIAADAHIAPDSLLVPPEKVVESAIDLVKSDILVDNLLVSLSRVAKGFLVGSSLGLLIGILIGVSKGADEFLSPLLRTVRQVPLLGWMPLIILWFGIGELSKVVFIAIGAFFPTMLNTASGIRGVSKEYLEVGKVYQLSKPRLLFLIIIPSALPSIVTGVRLSMSLSWMMVVGAEMISANSGIGQMMTAARDMFRTDIVMVGIIVIGIVGFLIDMLIKKIEAAIIRWQMTVK